MVWVARQTHRQPILPPLGLKMRLELKNDGEAQLGSGQQRLTKRIAV